MFNEIFGQMKAVLNGLLGYVSDVSYSGRSLAGVNYALFPISTLVAVFGGKR